MSRWSLFLALGLALAAGCADAKKPVPISGTVTTSTGKPVSGVRLILAPAQDAPMSPIGSFGFDLNAEGRFEGAVVPGKYVYYLSTVSVQRDDDDGHPVNFTEAKKLKASAKILKSIPAAYHSARGADANRQVEVTSGANLALVVPK